MECPPGTVPFPNKISTCQSDSKWTKSLQCLGQCDLPEVRSQGELVLEDGSEPIVKTLQNVQPLECQRNGEAQDVSLTKHYEGTECFWTGGFCGVDDEGFVFFPKKKKITCKEDGSWAFYENNEKTSVTGPMCRAQPCSQAEKESLPNADQLDCAFEDKNLSAMETKAGEKHNEKVSCTLISCVDGYSPKDDSKEMTCEAGTWQPHQVACAENVPCPLSELKDPSNGKAFCNVDGPGKIASTVIGGVKMAMGGESCGVCCNNGYHPSRDKALCAGGQWREVRCGRYHKVFSLKDDVTLCTLTNL